MCVWVCVCVCVCVCPRPSDPPLSDAELEAAAQRVAVELTRGGTPTEKMQWLEGLGLPLWRAAHEGWDRETKHSLYDSDARQGALAAALGSVEKNPLTPTCGVVLRWVIGLTLIGS